MTEADSASSSNSQTCPAAADAKPALHVETHPGPRPDSPRVLLVHGTLDRAATFQRVRRRLTNYTVVLVDRRGYGDSVALAPAHGTANHARDIIDALHEGGPATVVGHSYGGLVALEAARQRPDLVTTLGVYEPPLPFLDWWERRGDPGQPGALPSDPALASEHFFRSVVGDHAWERLPESFRAARRAEGPALLEDIRAANSDAIDIGGITTPVLVGHGSAGARHFARGAAELVELLPNAALQVLEGAGHGAHMSHADGFAAFTRSAQKRR